MLRLKKDDRISIKSDEWRTNVSSGGETEELEKCRMNGTDSIKMQIRHRMQNGGPMNR